MAFGKNDELTGAVLEEIVVASKIKPLSADEIANFDGRRDLSLTSAIRNRPLFANDVSRSTA